MPFLRRISTQRLILLCVAVLAVAATGTAIAIAAGSGGPTPPPKPLAKAVHDAIASPELQGVTARVEFTNNLLDGADVRGANPLISGAGGRLWATNDGHFRLELQSTGGDAQVVSDGRSWWVYDASSNRVWRGTVPQERGRRRNHSGDHRVPSIGRIQRVINRVMRHAAITGPTPSTVAGRPAYNVRVSPRRDGGLLGAVEFAWDASRGNPLRGAVYARGASDPVLELKATDISYGPVSSDVFQITPPAGAQSKSVGPGGARNRLERRAHGRNGNHHGPLVTGERRVEQRLGFNVDAPATLAGRTRRQVALIGHRGGGRAALVTYGRGLGGIAVIERRANGSGSDMRNGPLGDVQLPTVDVNGTSAQELETPLGTAIRFERGGVRYLVIGSVTRADAEAAARGL